MEYTLKTKLRCLFFIDFIVIFCKHIQLHKRVHIKQGRNSAYLKHVFERQVNILTSAVFTEVSKDVFTFTSLSITAFSGYYEIFSHQFLDQ